jgi:hypothetical protein
MMQVALEHKYRFDMRLSARAMAASHVKKMPVKQRRSDDWKGLPSSVHIIVFLVHPVPLIQGSAGA